MYIALKTWKPTKKSSALSHIIELPFLGEDSRPAVCLVSFVSPMTSVIIEEFPASISSHLQQQQQQLKPETQLGMFKSPAWDGSAWRTKRHHTPREWCYSEFFVQPPAKKSKLEATILVKTLMRPKTLKLTWWQLEMCVCVRINVEVGVNPGRKQDLSILGGSLFPGRPHKLQQRKRFSIILPRCL